MREETSIQLPLYQPAHLLNDAALPIIDINLA
jgi:hypothetical protein